MAFLEDSLTSVVELKKKVSISSIAEEIQNNVKLPLAQDTPVGERPLPTGSGSPFMLIFDTVPNSEDGSVNVINDVCKDFGINEDDLYITSLIKFPTENFSVSDATKHIRAFLGKEILAVEPEIIFICGELAIKAFTKNMALNKKFDGLTKTTINFTIDKHSLSNSLFIYPLAGDITEKERTCDVVEKLYLDWNFVHLHCHNSLSLKDGIGTPDTRIKWHVDKRKPAIATSNHGNICDWYKIHEGATKNGMKPILGVELYFNRYAKLFEDALNGTDKEDIQKRKKYKTFNRHITMFAKNETGFHNLMKIHNDAWINRFYRFPIASPDTIKDNAEGIICLSGCSSGEQNKLIWDKVYLKSDERKKEIDFLIEDKTKSMSTLMNTKNDERAMADDYLDAHDMEYFYEHSTDKKLNKEEYQEFARDFILKNDEIKINQSDKEARAVVDWWHRRFGDDYYIELMTIDYGPQRDINQELVKIAKEKNIKMVITNDAHYIHKSDSQIQKLQMLSDQDKTFEDLEEDEEAGTNKIWTIKSRELYYKSVDEMHEAWQKWHESDIFTEEVFWEAIRNTISITDKITPWELDRSDKLPILYGDGGLKILLEKIMKGMKDYGLEKKKEYQERLAFELSVIKEKGYIDYFLVMEDIVGWIKNKYGITAIGPGRGSAAGGLVNYLLGLTYVDPIKHNLLFERFLDLAREDLPDIDQDVQPRIRNAVVDYMREKFGETSVAPIGTFGLLKTKSAIQDVGRVLGVPSKEVYDVTTKMVGADDKASLEELEEEFPQLKALFKRYSDVGDGYSMKYYVDGIRGSQRQAGTHAAGVLISRNKLTENIPLIRSKKTIVSGWIDGEDGRELSGLNYAKMDVLGLKNLEVIEDSIKLIEERHNKSVDPYTLDINDKFVYENVVQAGDNYGVFQFESALAGQLIKNIQPEVFDNLSDISALMRPGPLEMGTPSHYAERKNEGGWTVEDIPECIRDILKDSYGLIVYQEQIMLIAEKIGGHTKKETNRLRKLIIKYGKFSKDDPGYISNMKYYYDKFIENAQKEENLGSEKAAQDMWELMANFAAYGFNKSHSVSYSYISFIQYWLKAYYDSEFNVALLNNTDIGKKSKEGNVISEYLSKVQSKGYTISPPNINYSTEKFNLKSDTEIVWGMAYIKGVSSAVVEKIVAERNERGQFSDIDDVWNRLTKSVLNKRVWEALIWSGAFDDFLTKNKNDDNTKTENEYGKIFRDRFELHHYVYQELRKEKKYEPVTGDIRFLVEKEVDFMKLSLSEAKVFDIQKKIVFKKNKFKINPVYEITEKGTYAFVGKVTGLQHKKTKGGKDYKLISIRDETGSLNRLYVWPWKCDNHEELATGKFIEGHIEINEQGFSSLEYFDRLYK